MVDATRRTHCILDAHYDFFDQSKVVSDITKLTEEERAALHTLLNNYELLFDRTLGTWKMRHVDIELYNDAKIYHEKSYLVSITQEDVFKK